MIHFPAVRKLALLLSSFVLLACSLLNQAPIAESPVNPLPVAMITFRLVVPEPVASGEKVYLAVLDEVTGLAFNQQRFLMQAEGSTNFLLILPFPVGSVVKYRYMIERAYTVQEHTSDGRAVRYRLVHVTSPGTVSDVVSRWTDTAYHQASGRITGSVTDAQSGQPIPDILISAGGSLAITAADGTYLIEGLPPGTHNLVAYAMDGAYQTFQQGADVAADSATTAPLKLQSAALVPVSFLVSLPENTPSFATVRFAGNLSQLGNSFADLFGGLNVAPERMPVLTPLDNGQYTLTLALPGGADIRYKYTLGDGIWNAEQTLDNKFQVRQLIVPTAETILQDRVDTWQSGQVGPVTFHVAVPAVTPGDETISIQLNPGYGWTEPIPMWNMGNNQWRYTLFSPLEGLPNLLYRYCRGNLCSSADEARQAVREFKPAAGEQLLTDVVESWRWYPAPPAPVTVPSLEVVQRAPDFMAGLAFQSSFTPAWGVDQIHGLKDAESVKANWVMLSATWSATRSNPPRLEPIPGKDLSFPDLTGLVLQARSSELNAAIIPSIRFPTPPELWFQQSTRDFSWWVSWFDAYRGFILHHASLAAQSGASALVIGGNWLSPSLPGGRLADGTSSNVPGDAEATWRLLIQDIRARFNGILLWGLSYPQGMQNIPPFLDAVDRIYLTWEAPLAQDGNASEDLLFQQASVLLDRDILPLQQRFGKPVILVVSYPSVDGAATACLPSASGSCFDFDLLDRPNPEQPNLVIDLDEQAMLYNALLHAVNERPWIGGVISGGYFPMAPLQDQSTSVNGKPAAGVLWYWYPLFLGR